jgi:hypothetical protein
VKEPNCAAMWLLDSTLIQEQKRVGFAASGFTWAIPRVQVQTHLPEGVSQRILEVVRHCGRTSSRLVGWQLTAHSQPGTPVGQSQVGGGITECLSWRP